ELLLGRQRAYGRRSAANEWDTLLDAMPEAEREAVWRAIAGNPNLPAEQVFAVASRYPREVLANPAMPLYLLEDSTFLNRLPRVTQKHLLADTAAPANWLRILAQSGDPEIARVARRHVALSGESPAGWEQDLDREIWRLKIDPQHVPPQLLALLAVGAVPGWLFGPLLINESLALRKAAAASPGAPRALLAALWRAGAARTFRGYVQPDPTLDPIWLDRLAQGERWSCGLVARNPAAPGHVLEQLAAHKQGDIRAWAAQHPAMPPRALGRLAGDAEIAVRAAVARNQAASPALLDRLAGDAHPEVALGVARRRDLGAALVDRLAESPHWQVRKAVAWRENLPASVAERLAGDANPAIHEKIALQRDLSAAALERLAAHGSPRVAAILARKSPAPRGRAERPPYAPRTVPPRPDAFPALRSTLSADQVVEYARSGSEWQCVDAARQAAAPPEILAELARHNSWRVRAAVAGHPAAPAESLAWLAGPGGDKQYDSQIRHALIDNPALPAELFAALITQLPPDVGVLHPRSSRQVRRECRRRLLDGLRSEPSNQLPITLTALAQPDCPPEWLERHSADLNWLCRYAVVRNPAAPPALLERLAQDADHGVRAAARAALAGRAPREENR
ncbi:MAG TPA: hypothetical protein VD886_12145, partial [Herpetosiphonaceae bacterium]|nr:hypothetical protein [Herpetosiphonaceae bacterium]